MEAIFVVGANFWALRGLKFVLLKPRADHVSTLLDVQQYFRRLCLAAHFGSVRAPLEDTSDDEDVKLSFPYQPSMWTPNVGEFKALKRYINRCEDDVAMIRSKPVKHFN